MNLLRLMRIVLWSFFGVRKGTSHASDFANTKPATLVLLVVVAVLIAIGFGVVLFTVARLAAGGGHPQ